MADAAQREPATDVESASSRIDRLEMERRALNERAEQADRELRSAKAEIEVKAEFVAALESELDETLGFLRAKTAYIESLPWVRLKVWFKGLRRSGD